MALINLVLPTAAVAFAWLLSLIAAAKQKHATARTFLASLREATLRGVGYLAAIGMLEVLGRYEPVVASLVAYAAYTITAVEAASGIALLGQVTGDQALTSALQIIAQRIGEAPVREASQAAPTDLPGGPTHG